MPGVFQDQILAASSHMVNTVGTVKEKGYVHVQTEITSCPLGQGQNPQAREGMQCEKSRSEGMCSALGDCNRLF